MFHCIRLGVSTGSARGLAGVRALGSHARARKRAERAREQVGTARREGTERQRVKMKRGGGLQRVYRVLQFAFFIISLTYIIKMQRGTFFCFSMFIMSKTQNEFN